ncbi:MAG TPA: DUF1028 domain-containing protein [Candidatus Eisenbacteria bacterium]|nr:DUF1028 domain-containing protein [Candidatus Eisenbacteria bacterium]
MLHLIHRPRRHGAFFHRRLSPRARFWVIVAALTAAVYIMGFVFASRAHATFSIAAYDSVTQEIGVAVQSRAFSVGGAVPWVEAGVGAIATQASTNESFGPLGLERLRRGEPAADVLRALLAADSGSAHRQAGIVDAKGRSASFTGGDCSAWAGHRDGPGYAIQGNILAGEAVVAGMERAFLETKGDLGHRLLAALEAGQAAGGDKRGMQSAALIVGRPSDDYPEYRTRYVDLRVEDAKDPIREIRRVYLIHETGRLAEAHLRFAAAAEKAGRNDLALVERTRVGEALQRAVARGEKDPQNLNSLAWVCATNDMYLPEAVAAAERAASLEPKDTSILDTLAECYFRAGKPAKAIETMGRALALAPDDNYLKGQMARFRAATK